MSLNPDALALEYTNDKGETKGFEESKKCA
jgi:hypothetical protein